MKKKSEPGPAWLGPARLVWAQAPLGLPWLGQLGLGPGSGSAQLGLAKLVLAVLGLSGSARFEHKLA